MEIITIHDMYQNLINKRLCEFFGLLSKESKELIINEYNRLKKDTAISKNQILCQQSEIGKQELVLEEGSGIHNIYDIAVVPEIAISKMLLPRAIFSGDLIGVHTGNSAPFCSHFVRMTHSYTLTEIENMIRKEDSELNRTERRFLRYSNFARLAEMIIGEKYPGAGTIGYINYFPILFVYKRKNQDIDVFNDQNLSIHKDFFKFHSIVNMDEDFQYCKDNLMAILGGIPISKLDGIIISEKVLKNTTFYSDFELSSYIWDFDSLLEYLVQLFPNLYIANEKGTLLYVPDNAQVITRVKTL